MDRAEFDDITFRYQTAALATEMSTWPHRAETYGPVVAQLVMLSFKDIPALLQEVKVDE